MFFNSNGPDVLILTGNRLKPIKDKSLGKTKLSPINSSAKAKKNLQRNNTSAATLDDIFNRNDSSDDDDDTDEIQGDASGITVPASKSLGK